MQSHFPAKETCKHDCMLYEIPNDEGPDQNANQDIISKIVMLLYLYDKCFYYGQKTRKKLFFQIYLFINLLLAIFFQ